MSLLASETVYEARHALCDMFGGAATENVVFTYNATYALNLAIKCFIPSGSHVLISDIEHNAVYRPIVKETMKGRLCFDIFTSCYDSKEKLIGELKRKTRFNTKAIICNAASNICGLFAPLDIIGEYAKSKNMLFIVDASQCAGHKKIDMKSNNISILCAPFHKGLYGPQGGGFMIVSDNIKSKNTLIEGGSGVNSSDMTMPKDLPEKFEAGTLSTPSIAGLLRSVEYLRSAGQDNIERYEKHISHLLRDVLCSYEQLSLHGDTGQGSVFSVTSSIMSVEELASRLDENGIIVRSGLHCAPLAHKKLGTHESGTVRFSTGIFNTEDDINRLDDVLRSIFRQ